MFTLLQFFIVSIIILVFGLWIATKFPFEGLTAAMTIIIFLLSIGTILVESMGQKKIYELKMMETKNLELMVNGKYLEEIQDGEYPFYIMKYDGKTVPYSITEITDIKKGNANNITKYTYSYKRIAVIKIFKYSNKEKEEVKNIITLKEIK